MNFTIRFKGGAGSGHFGHKGRPGEQGGSLPKDGSASSVSPSPIDDYEKYKTDLQAFNKKYSGWRQIGNSYNYLMTKFTGTSGKPGRVLSKIYRQLNKWKVETSYYDTNTGGMIEYYQGADTLDEAGRIAEEFYKRDPKSALEVLNPSKDYSIHDIEPYIGDYVHEVEQNIGKPVTWREVYDILNDFGTIPAGMSDADWDKLAKKLAKSYA